MSHWLDIVIDLFKAETKDLRELAKIAGADPATFYRGVEPTELDLEEQDIDGIEFSSSEAFIDALLDGSSINIGIGTGENLIMETGNLARFISSFKRQEERVSLLLRLVLEHRYAAIHILEQYGSDRAKYANLALAELLNALRLERDQMELFEEEDAQMSFLSKPTPSRIRLADDELARIVHRTFSSIPPSNRSALLFYMAKHLSSHLSVNKFLRSTIARSRSMFTEPNKPQILELLEDASPPSWLELLDIPHEEGDDGEKVIVDPR